MSEWNTKDYRVEEIIRLIIDRKISVPQYQRGQVWTASQEKLLIDSIKSGYPFGSILLYKKNDDDYHLIDGLQRCTTLYRYISKPAKFFDKRIDVSEEVVELIYKSTGISNNEVAVKAKIRDTIETWVIENYSTLIDISEIDPLYCARTIKDKFPTISSEGETSIYSALFKMFSKYKKSCDQISKANIPAIVYSGSESNLPEVFKRINSKGTHLSKYQILAATWSSSKIKIISDELSPILKFISRFYSEIEIEGFALSDDQSDITIHKKVSLYQFLFGFGKYIIEKHPLLFGKNSSDKSVESVGFNLFNACVANRNTELKFLPEVIDQFLDNEEVYNDFVLKIIKSIEEVEKTLKPYLAFKLNSRQTSTPLYHTEMQICSMIANVFIIKHLDLVRDENDSIIKRAYSSSPSRMWNNNKQKFKDWAFINYLYDILRKEWSGTGDKLLDQTSLNHDYYTKERKKDQMYNLLSTWFSESNNRQEYVKIPNPKNDEKLLMSVLYSQIFSAHDQLSNTRYDIEHICPKNLMKKKLDKYKGQLKLPISSFGNICLLPEFDNRKKKDRTIYNDDLYMNSVSSRLNDIETKYTFTTRESLQFLEADQSLEDFKSEYFKFIESRFEIVVKKILDNLFSSINR